MSERVELRMKCPVCGVRNHSVTFLADGPTTYHDCGHTTADHLLPVPGPSSPPSVELSPEAIEQIQRYKHGQQSDTLRGVLQPPARQEYEGVFPPPEACPECVQGKHANCDGTAWDIGNDMSIECACAARRHQ